MNAFARRRAEHGGQPGRTTGPIRLETTSTPVQRAPSDFKITVEFREAAALVPRALLFKRRRGLPHRARQIASDAVVGLRGGAPEQDHDDERIGATYERAYQGVLVHPVDLSQKPADPVALHPTFGARPWGKPDLERHVVPERLSVHDAVEQPYTPYRDRLHVVLAPVEERPDETPPL